MSKKKKERSLLGWFLVNDIILWLIWANYEPVWVFLPDEPNPTTETLLRMLWDIILEIIRNTIH